MSKTILLLLFLCVFVECGLSQTKEPDQDYAPSWRSRINNAPDDLLQTLVELQKRTAIVEELIPELTTLLKDGSEPVRRLAVRCLHQAGEKASPAVANLVFNLDHRDYLFRSEVMQTLKAIGPSAVPELKEALKSPSARIRASALSTLNSLAAVEAELLEGLQNDPDSRVRIGVAQAWKKHGKRGVEKIAALLTDPESVVAIGAAQALRFHFEDPPKAIKHLRESLSRKDSGYSSALALQTFGVEAQIAIPDLIRSIPIDFSKDFLRLPGEDMVSKVLEHIGPPRLADLESFRQLLSDTDTDKVTIAARMIGQLGTDAKAAAPQLEDLFQSSLLGHLKVSEQAAMIADESTRDEFLYKNNAHASICIAACSAYWRVSRNTERFAQLVEQLAPQRSFYFLDPPFSDFQEKDVPYLRMMLESANVNVREAVLNTATDDLPNETISLEMISAVRKQGQLTGPTLKHLISNSTKNTRPQLMSALIEDVECEVLELNEFASAVTSLKIHDARVARILTNGLDSPSHYIREKCLAALVAIASDDQESIGFFLAIAEKDKSFRPASLEALLKQQRASELALPFATKCLFDTDWTRNYAIALLARIGPAASESMPKLKQIAENISKESKNGEINEARLRSIIALARVSEDKSEFKKHFDLAMSDQTDDGRRSLAVILNLLKELGPDGDSFMDEISQLLQFASSHRISDQYTLENGLTLLAIVGSPRSIELLKTFQFDRDWKIQSKVKRLLKMIDEGTELNYGTYIP